MMTPGEAAREAFQPPIDDPDRPDPAGALSGSEWYAYALRHAERVIRARDAEVRSSTVGKSVWVVMESVRFEEPSLALLADSQESAKKGAAKYVGEESLEWEQRNGMFDSQDYFVAEHSGDEYHIYEQEIEHHG